MIPMRDRAERFARPGGRVQNDVLLLKQLQQRLLLRRIKREPPRLDVIEEAPQERIGGDPIFTGQQIIKRVRHFEREVYALEARLASHLKSRNQTSGTAEPRAPRSADILVGMVWRGHDSRADKNVAAPPGHRCAVEAFGIQPYCVPTR